MNQATTGEQFAALHRRSRAFFVPNPWDVGTARLLEHLGFEALATTGAGYAFSLGQRDGSSTREGMLAHVAAIANATRLPVTADLEDGFGDDPATVHDTVLAAASCGAVGCSIEDRSYGRGGGSVAGETHDLALAVDRIRAAAEAARSLPFPFVLTARCENFLIGRPDLPDTIRRVQAFQEAGADCLYAPGLVTSDQIRDVVRAVDRPVNVVMGLVGDPISLGELEAIGVRRVSLGSTLARTALGAFMAAAVELRDHGTGNFAARAIPYAELDALFARRP